MNVHWSWDDLRIIADIVAGSLLAGALRLIVLKAFLEPVATYVGQQAYRRADRVPAGRLPNLPTAEP